MSELQKWKEDQEKYNWTLPPKEFVILRLPIIRYFRWFVLNWRVYRAAEQWRSCGIGLGIPNQYDLWVLYAIAKGWC